MTYIDELLGVNGYPPDDIPPGQGSYWNYIGDRNKAGRITGKYLFFCREQAALVALAQHEINDHHFTFGKVSTNNRSGDYVLCLYWCDDSRKRELYERYKDTTGIKYRWWKSDADTCAGKYSQKYLKARHWD